MVVFTSSSTRELEQILALQSNNLLKNVGTSDKKTQGFVTIRHNMNLLFKIHPHTIAKDGEKVIGYALSTPIEFKKEFPIPVVHFK